MMAAAAGAAWWLGITHLTGRREAWDSGLYFSWFLPSMAVILIGLGFFAPERAWRWGFAPFIGQALVAFIQNPAGNLLPMGLMVFAFYGAVCALPAMLGAGVRRRLDKTAG